MSYASSNLLGIVLGFLLGAGLLLLYAHSWSVALGIAEPEFTSLDYQEAFLCGLVTGAILGFPLGWLLRRLGRISQ